MRHRKLGRKLNRTPSHRKAMLRNMVTSLFEHERITTTDAKAKELIRIADSMITLAKKGDLSARRQALAVIRSKEITRKLFDTIIVRYKDQSGGYTKAIKVGRRQGDNSPISIVELLPGKAEKKTS